MEDQAAKDRPGPERAPGQESDVFLLGEGGYGDGTSLPGRSRGSGGGTDQPRDLRQRRDLRGRAGTGVHSRLAVRRSKHVGQSMIEGRRGRIINIISTAGHQGEPWNIGYCTGKSGLLNFTRSAAMELAEFGIRVNSLTPTATDTAEGLARAGKWGVPFRRPSNSSPRRRGFLAPGLPGVPLGRLPSPTDYAQAAVFLASDDAAMITGADLKVDAGALARYWRWGPSVPPPP